MEWVPGCDAVDLLGGGCDCNSEDSAQSDEHTESDGLRPENLSWIFGVTCEVGHIECEGCFGGDGGCDALEEDYGYWCAVFDVGSFGEGGSETLG